MNVSQILLETYGVSIRPGAKGECPFCGAQHFQVKADDTLGKCFHPNCGQFVTMRSHNEQFGLARALQGIYLDWHAELLSLANGQQNAYSYLHDERQIHPQVITDAMLGAVPWSYDPTPHFQPVIDAAQQDLDALRAGKKGRPTKKTERAEQRLKILQDALQTFIQTIHGKAGWLAFFYGDAGHRLVSIRLRQPYAKKFASFKPYKGGGLFGRELFTPVASPMYASANDHLIVVEGEFNALQLQSLTMRYEEQTGQPLGYLNTCAVGGVQVADIEAIQCVTQHPVVLYDNDTNHAGVELLYAVQRVMTCESATTPDLDTDLDVFIKGFAPDAVAAWMAVQQLFAKRETSLRKYSGTGEEFFEKGIGFVPKLLGEALLERHRIKFSAEVLWRYDAGAYRSNGTAELARDMQELLGDRRKESCLQETFRFIEVATYTEAPEPDTRHINLANGRLDWNGSGALEPHDHSQFTIVQLPVEYDPTAQAPAFQRYLDTTFDPDVHPLIEELLGWCLIPDRRFEKTVMLTGEGENGKSVLLDLIGYLLGENNVSNIALQDLEENRFRVAELYGKLANIFSDLDARGLKSSSMFKTLTTGDWITAERKFGQPFRFRSYAKLLFSANKVPSSSDRTHAFYRRWIIIPFTRVFDGLNGNPTPDKNLREKLKGELPGVLNRALQGLQRLNAHEAFSQPQSVREALQAYIRQNDSVRVFLEECCTINPSATVEKQRLYEAYKQWCADNGELALSQRKLKEGMEAVVPKLDEWRASPYSPRHWIGIELV